VKGGAAARQMFHEYKGFRISNIRTKASKNAGNNNKNMMHGVDLDVFNATVNAVKDDRRKGNYLDRNDKWKGGLEV
jgi:hypothetical protein